MNDKRETKKRFLNNALTSELDNSWDGLGARLDALERRAMYLHQTAVLELIRNTQRVIKRYTPNKKLYRTIIRKVQELEDLVAKIELLRAHQKTR